MKSHVPITAAFAMRWVTLQFVLDNSFWVSSIHDLLFCKIGLTDFAALWQNMIYIIQKWFYERSIQLIFKLQAMIGGIYFMTLAGIQAAH